MNKQFWCSVCDASFSLNIYLRRHVKKHHPDVELNVVAPKLTAKFSYKFKCSTCERNFNNIDHLKFHERKKHGIGLDSYVRIKKIKCPLCDWSDKEKKNFFIHTESVHNISIINEELNFLTFEEFLQWKEYVERDTLSFYVLNSGAKQNSKKSVTRHYFTCHRSGYYNSKGKGKRHLKTQGSRKINGTCPASIQVLEDEDGRCKVNYISTHVGHENDIQHLSLTKSERENLAVDIANKIPFQEILDKVQDSIVSAHFGRINLLQRKDLYNIQSRYNLGTSSLQYEGDDMSVEAWEEVTTSEYNENIEYNIECVENNNISPPYSTISKINEKVNIREKLLQLSDTILTFTDYELEVVSQSISSLEATLNAMQNES